MASFSIFLPVFDKTLHLSSWIYNTETSTEKAIKNLIGHIGGYQPGDGPQRGVIVGHVVDRGMFVVDTYMKELSKAEKTFTASLDKMNKEYQTFKQELRDSGLTKDEISKNTSI